jgi:hypothetical protein
MPEFILDSSGVVTPPCPVSWAPKAESIVMWCDLDAFTQGYIEALFFTSQSSQVTTEEFQTLEYKIDMEAGRMDGVLPCDVGFADLSPEALASIIADCQAFLAAVNSTPDSNGAYLLDRADAMLSSGYDHAQAGRDFWFTRNGHGVGFWDRGLGDIGETLSAACGHGTPFATVDPYFGGDGRVHV